MAVRCSHQSAVCIALLATPVAAAAIELGAAAPAAPTPDEAALRAQPLQQVLAQQMRRYPRRPEWLRDYSDPGIDFDHQVADGDRLNLVLQEDRRDGPDLLTLRYPMLKTRRARAYVGAGISQILYVESTETGPTVIFAPGNRHRSITAAAEVGVETRWSERLHLSADLRWVDLDPRADLLRVGDAVVGADAVAVTVNVGWRFR